MAAESLNFLVENIFLRSLEGGWVKVSAKKFVMAEISVKIFRTIFIKSTSDLYIKITSDLYAEITVVIFSLIIQ